MKNLPLESLYHHIRLIHENIQNKLDEQARSLGFNGTELAVLVDILSHENTDSNAIANRLGMKKSCLSKTIKNLEDSIHVDVNPKDKRFVMLSIKSEELKQKLCPETMLENIFGDIETNQLDPAQLNELLIKLNAMLSQE